MREKQLDHEKHQASALARALMSPPGLVRGPYRRRRRKQKNFTFGFISVQIEDLEYFLEVAKTQ